MGDLISKRVFTINHAFSQVFFMILARAFFDVKTNQINLSNYDYLEPDQGVKKEAGVTLFTGIRQANHAFSRFFMSLEASAHVSWR